MWIFRKESILLINHFWNCWHSLSKKNTSMKCLRRLLNTSLNMEKGTSSFLLNRWPKSLQNNAYRLSFKFNVTLFTISIRAFPVEHKHKLFQNHNKHFIFWRFQLNLLWWWEIRYLFWIISEIVGALKDS